MEEILQNFIKRAAYIARLLRDQTRALEEINVLWAGTPDYDTLITQEKIDAVPAFADAGLTVTKLTDALYALETAHAALSNASLIEVSQL